ncbi:CocE/NonD family hydrolase [Streptosporangium sp. KLBMP 9127]|nr:CocE/NonD family hydrolase [Streptosporangium sp. KLBMP 9127]
MPKLNRAPLAITTEHDAPIPMRDGTVLRADLHRPAAGGPFRTLLIRSPYGEPTLRSAPTIRALEMGFAVVLQHCRGRGGSDGEFRPWLDEGQDGYDTIEWITEQDWSDGDVVASGMSYLAGCALQAAALAPPALKGVVAAVTPHDFYDGLTYNGGALALGSALNWAGMQTMLGLMHATEAGDDVSAGFAQLMPVLTDHETALRTLPVRDVPGVSWWRDWVDHPTRDAYWEGFADTLRHDRIQVPVMHVGGWFDLFLTGTLENHRRLGGPLVIGPWAHMPSTATGDLNFGLAASQQAVNLERRQLEFLRAAPAPGDAGVQIFVMGANVWRDEESWPLERAVPTPFYLHSGGRLGTEEPPPDAAPSTYDYDPADPVPTVGGPLLLADPANVGPRDQRAVEQRPDVLCFTTDPLTTAVEVTGPLSVTLHAATSAAGTDWTAKLVDVWPDGRALSVIDGIVRTAATPSQPAEHTVDLVATSQLFPPGHRIRVEISSSNFPRFDRNLGAGDPSNPTMIVQHQTIYHDSARPSYITLPIVPGPNVPGPNVPGPNVS